MHITGSLAVALVSSAALTAALPQASPADSLMPRADILSMIKSAEQKIGNAGEEIESWLKDYFTGKFANLPIITSNGTTVANQTASGKKSAPTSAATKVPSQISDDDTADDDSSDDSDDTQENEKRDLDIDEVEDEDEDEDDPGDDLDQETEEGDIEARSLDEEDDVDNFDDVDNVEEDDDDEDEGIEARGLTSIFKGKKGKGKKPFKPGKGKGDDAPPGVVNGKHQGYCGWPKKSYPKSMGGGTDGRMFCIFYSRVGICTSCQEGKHKEFDECWC